MQIATEYRRVPISRCYRAGAAQYSHGYGRHWYSSRFAARGRTRRAFDALLYLLIPIDRRHMKRITLFPVSIALLLAIAACGDDPVPTAPDVPRYQIDGRPDVPPGPPDNAGRPVSVAFVNWNNEEVRPSLSVGLQVRVTDKQRRPVASRQVQWTSTEGGSFDPVSTLSDADGYATSTFTVSSLGGTQHAVTATAGIYSASITVSVIDFLAVVGGATVPIPRSDSCGNSIGRLCESLIGNVIADAMRTTHGTDFAFVNSGGIRAGLTCPESGSPLCPAYAPLPYVITRGQVINALPFGNRVVTLEVNGAELKAILENGISGLPSALGRFAQVSGLCFTYNPGALVGSRILGAVRQATNGACTGATVDLTSAAIFTLAQVDFTAGGGDAYPNFSARVTTHGVLEKEVSNYLTANSPITPTIQGRIVGIP